MCQNFLFFSPLNFYLYYHPRLQSLGALNVGYRSNVLCLAVTDIEFEKNMIICGSEDKSIKVWINSFYNLNEYEIKKITNSN